MSTKEAPIAIVKSSMMETIIANVLLFNLYNASLAHLRCCICYNATVPGHFWLLNIYNCLLNVGGRVSTMFTNFAMPMA